MAAAVLGFASGVVFWHFIGFWAFVTDVVYRSERSARLAPPPARDISDRRKLQTTIFGGLPPAESPAGRTCTSLRLDRTTGRTSIVPCESPSSTAAATETASRRLSFTGVPPPGLTPSPRAPHVAGWSTTVQDAELEDTRADRER